MSHGQHKSRSQLFQNRQVFWRGMRSERATQANTTLRFLGAFFLFPPLKSQRYASDSNFEEGLGLLYAAEPCVHQAHVGNIQ
jgi:hypothetical protein